MAENNDMFENQEPVKKVEPFEPHDTEEIIQPQSTSFTAGEESGQEDAPFLSSDAARSDNTPSESTGEPWPQSTPAENASQPDLQNTVEDAQPQKDLSGIAEEPDLKSAPFVSVEEPQPWSTAGSAGTSEPQNASYTTPDTGRTEKAPSSAASARQASAPVHPAKEKTPPKKKFSLKEWTPGPQFPNQLTIARICMIPLFVILLLWVPKPAGNILAMIVFIIASLTDTLDGHIARKYHYVTNFGKFMDPLADKLLVCSALICLVDLGRIESWIVIIIIAREFIISGFRLVAVEKGVVIAANYWGKIKTVLQMLMVILMIGNFGGFLGAIAQILKWLALLFTIVSLISYLLQNRSVLQDET